jgi:hypothetical protein
MLRVSIVVVVEDILKIGATAKMSRIGRVLASREKTGLTYAKFAQAGILVRLDFHLLEG